MVGPARHHDDRRRDGRPAGGRWRYQQQRLRPGRRGLLRRVPVGRSADRVPLDVQLRARRQRGRGWSETYRFVEADGRTTVTAIGHMGMPRISTTSWRPAWSPAIETWDRLEALLTELSPERRPPHIPAPDADDDRAGACAAFRGWYGLRPLRPQRASGSPRHRCRRARRAEVVDPMPGRRVVDLLDRGDTTWRPVLG